MNQDDLSRAAKEFFSDQVKCSFRDRGGDSDDPLVYKDQTEMMVEYAGWRGTVIIEKKLLAYDTDGRYLKSRFELLMHGLARLVFTKNNK